MCEVACACVCTARGSWQVSFSVVLDLGFWDKISSWTWELELLSCLDEQIIKLWEPPAPASPTLGLQTGDTTPTFYMVARGSNSGPCAGQQALNQLSPLPSSPSFCLTDVLLSSSQKLNLTSRCILWLAIQRTPFRWVPVSTSTIASGVCRSCISLSMLAFIWSHLALIIIYLKLISRTAL